jgi:ATP phosphoribosyltransferase
MEHSGARAGITVALSKGRLFEGSAALFARAGLPFPRNEGRRLVVERGGLRFLFVKDVDVPTYVEYGVADVGVAGRDVLLESRADVYEPLDLGFGRCRIVVACPAGADATLYRASTVRVASKYPRVASAHFLEHGLSAEVVRLSGSVEIAPGLGLGDCIVDVVETGRTLGENGLEVVEEVAVSSARLIVNRASYHARRSEVSALVEALARATNGAPAPLPAEAE